MRSGRYDDGRAPVAQWTERGRPKACVGGSSPSGGATSVVSGTIVPIPGHAAVRSPGYPARVTHPRIPQEVLAAAHARARVREARDWAEADRLRATIAAAGWKIVDRGTDFALSPVAPPDLVDGERVRYGSSVSVPSRLEEAPVGLATIILIATDWPDDLARSLIGLGAGTPAGTSVVIVADGPSSEQAIVLDALESVSANAAIPVEVVWTSQRLGHAAAINVGFRRVPGPVAILLEFEC